MRRRPNRGAKSALSILILFATLIWWNVDVRSQTPKTQIPGSETPKTQAPGSETTGNQFCPVTAGEPVEENIFLDYEGERIYFCCKKCRRDFMSNPEMYLASLATDDSAGDPAGTNDGGHGDQPSAHDHSHNNSHDHDSDSSEGSSVQPQKNTGVLSESSETSASDQHIDSHVGSNDDHKATEHDHAKDHKSSNRLVTALGKFHPLIIHFPIALITVAAFFLVLSLFIGGEISRVIAIKLTYLAAIAAVFSAGLGLAAAEGSSYPSFLQSYLYWHRILGLTVAGLAFICAVLARRAETNPTRRNKIVFAIALFSNSVIVAVAGHFGATLIYGPEYFSF